ncbi:50S ribosomal protein L32 [Enterobacteriaceae endosymbiont of Macroplea mutica]|uniref:50S ribosomal protein L32 n=1 Tax=Enterobacteriaceae endosymbiont of Macroplea mutica TaxID=2675791 RepID=UPI001449F567|nr:50S ribosomal protein L32 [Enterobacteriaceae endosymbiont of Macroplea mutica]QJC31118.1 50S ribosomal protein L32 [Enterobacteriaceae endosymbiont of Macroplea mutica]
MAVPKHKISKSKRGMRRAHQSLLLNNMLLINKRTGEKNLYHHISTDGFYRGKNILYKVTQNNN